MKRLVFALGLIAAATGCGLQAQNLVGYAKIPFDFRMGQSRMPAGDYELKYSGQALVLHERSRNGKTVLTLPNHATRPTSLQQPTLQFLHFGDTYVAYQARVPALIPLPFTRSPRQRDSKGRRLDE